MAEIAPTAQVRGTVELALRGSKRLRRRSGLIWASSSTARLIRWAAASPLPSDERASSASNSTRWL